MTNRLSGSLLFGFGLLLATVATQAHAQSSPKTITMVVPYAAGGGTDTVARLIGERMSNTLGQTIIIENVVGGGSTLANDRVARSAPASQRNGFTGHTGADGERDRRAARWTP